RIAVLSAKRVSSDRTWILTSCIVAASFLAGACCSPVPEATARRRSAVGTIAVAAQLTGDFRLRFHDALAPAAPPGLSSVGRLSVNGCPSLPKPARSPDRRAPSHWRSSSSLGDAA